MVRRFRKALSAPGLLTALREIFDGIEDLTTSRGLALSDCLMSGIAIFGLKYNSLLKFDRDARFNETVRDNLAALYGIERAPSDTRLRERLDDVDPHDLRPAFTRMFQLLQRGKGLEGYTYLGGHYLLSVDGTGYFSSHKVHCKNCCEKHHRDGTITYYHQVLGAVLVHPEQKEVFPFAPEPITKRDGKKKNDCERNAATRLLRDVRREHPFLKLIVVEDGLASNGPHIKHLKELNLRFILGAKPGDHKFLFDLVDRSPSGAEFSDEEGIRHEFRYLNKAPLNDANFDLEINFVEYWEKRSDGRKQRFSWVTDLPVEDHNLMEIMRAGRARWRIENETFPEEPRLLLRT